MVFVSVGTERFPFDRLVRAVDRVALQLSGEPILVQLGHTAYRPTACQWVRFLDYQEMVEHIKQARIVVSHAGVGSLLLCARLGKVPIVVPRLKRFREHVDDHQQELARRMAQLGYCRLADEPAEIESLMLEYEKRQATTQVSSSMQPALVQALSEYLDASNSRLTP